VYGDGYETEFSQEGILEFEAWNFSGAWMLEFGALAFPLLGIFLKCK
jgi:hypothetical protein